MYWSTDVKNIKICPRCGYSLEKEYHSYIIIVRIKNENEQFAVGTDGGYFCPECPVVVLDRDNFIKLASVGLSSRDMMNHRSDLQLQVLWIWMRFLKIKEINLWALKITQFHWCNSQKAKQMHMDQRKQVEISPAHAEAGKNIRNAAEGLIQDKCEVINYEYKPYAISSRMESPVRCCDRIQKCIPMGLDARY